MNKNRRHILYTWIILVCFAAGQWSVYAHYHAISRSQLTSSATAKHQHTISEKCQLCDAMHHTAMLHQSQLLLTAISVTNVNYQPCQYNFVSQSIVLASGRAPPLS